MQNLETTKIDTTAINQEQEAGVITHQFLAQAQPLVTSVISLNGAKKESLQSIEKTRAAKPIDPELIKFYEAFKKRERIMKSPVRHPAIDFEGDFLKLQRAEQEARQTLEKAEVEREQKAM